MQHASFRYMIAAGQKKNEEQKAISSNPLSRYHGVPLEIHVTVAVLTWARITFRKTFQNVIRPFPDLKA